MAQTPLTPAAAARRLVHAVADRLGALKRKSYRDGRPNALMRLWNRLDALLYRKGLVRPDSTAVLRVRGRHSGRTADVPVVVTRVGDADFVVSMLGPEVNWVRNVDASQGLATLVRRGHDVAVRLELVPVRERAPILRRYAALAPGARPHLGAGPDAPLEAFERIAGRHPVYRARALEHPGE